MKRHPRREEEVAVLHLWTHGQVLEALPYIRAIVASLREHWLDWQRSRLLVHRLAEKPGRLDRSRRIAHDEAVKETAEGERRFHEALEELQGIDVYLLDPNQGLALIPFGHEEELSWIVFDLFAADNLVGWRYHRDPLETRRPLAEILNGARIMPLAN